MKNNSKQIQGREVVVGWSIGRAPLALRGIRFAEGEDGGDGGEQQPDPKPQPKPAPETYSREYVKDLRGEAKAHREAREAAEKALADAKGLSEADAAELAELRAERVTRARNDAIRSAGKDIADVDALLDSQAFATAIKDVDTSKADDVKAAVTKFVEANARFAAQPVKSRSHGAPATGTKSRSGGGLAGAVDRFYESR